jgi:tape measure domain-containing protein
MSIATEIRLRIKAEGEGVLKGLSGKLQDIANGTQVSSEKFKLLSTALKDIQSATAKSTNSIKDYSAAWRLLAGSVDASSAEFKEATKEANQLDAKLKSFQGSQTAVANNFRNIATAATEATAAMAAAARVTSTGLRMDPLTGVYRGIPGQTQYGQPIGPALPPTLPPTFQARRDVGPSVNVTTTGLRRDPFTGAYRGTPGVTQYAEPIGPSLPAPRPAFYGRSTMAAPMGQQGAGGFRTGARVAGTAAAAGIFGGPEGALGALGGGLVGGVEGAAVGAGLGALVSQLRQLVAGFATYTAEIDKQRIALKGLTTSNSEYKASLQTVERLSQEFQIPQEQVTRNFTKLAASVIGAGGNLQAAEVAFRGIASGVRGTGGNLRDLDSALLATSQVFSKGKVSAEELRQQIGERLPGAFTLFAKSIGKTPQQLDKMLEDGQVTLNDFLTFTQSLVTKYGATQAQIVLSSQAAGDRLAVAFAKIQEDIGRALQPIGAELQDALTKALSQNKEAIVAFAQGMANAAKAIIEFTVKFGPAILEVGKFVAVLLTVSAAAKTFMALSGGFSMMFALLSSGFAATSQKAIVAQSRLTAFGLAAKGLARSLAGPIVITLVLLGAEKIIQAFTRVKNARDALANVKNMPSGEQFLRNIGGSKTDRETLIRNLNEITKASSQARTSLSKKEIRLESNKVSGFEKEQLRPEIEALKAEIKVREDQYQTLSRALQGAKSGVKPLDANMFGADTTGGAGKAKGETAAANALAASKERTEVLKQETATIDKIAAFQEKINNATRIGNQQAALTLTYEQDRAKIQGEFGKQMEKLAQTDNRGEEAKALLSKTQAQLEALALDNRGKMTALKLQESAAGYQTLTQLQQEDLIAKQILAGKGEEARLQVEIANTIRDVKDPALRATLAKQIRANAEAKKELTLAENLKQIYTDLGMTIKDGVIGAIQGAIDGTKSLGEAAAGVLRNIANRMLDIAVNMALFGSISGMGSKGGGLLGLIPGLDKRAKGGVYAQNGIQAFARGGIVNGPTLFPFAKGIGLMGEAGPEAIMPLRRGRDGNLGVMSSGGGTTNVVVNVDASGSSVEGDQSQAKALGNAISAAVQSELVKQKRPGGLLA